MLRTIFVFAIMIVGLGAAVWSRFAALLLYVWFALFRPQEWVWFDMSSLRLSLVTGLILVVPSLLTGVFPNLTHPLSIGFVVFLISGLLGQLDAVRPDIGWMWLDFLFRLVLVSLLAITLVNSRRRLIMLMGVISLSFGFHSAKAGLASILGGGVRYFEGVGGSFIDNNAYALATVMILPLLIAAGQNSTQRWLRWGFYAAVPLSVMTVISLFSRGGFLALGASLAVFVALQKRKMTAVVILLVALGVGLYVAPIPEGYFNRLATIRTYDEVGDASALGRLHFWRVAVDMVLDHPLGIGLWNYQSAYDQYDSSGGQYGSSRAVHSSHFQVLAEQGFLGAFTYAAMFIYAMRTAFRIRRRATTELPEEDRRFLSTTSTALIVSMTGFLVGGSFIAMALNDLTWLTFALVASLDRMTASAAVPIATTLPDNAWKGKTVAVDAAPSPARVRSSSRSTSNP